MEQIAALLFHFAGLWIGASLGVVGTVLVMAARDRTPDAEQENELTELVRDYGRVVDAALEWELAWRDAEAHPTSLDGKQRLDMQTSRLRERISNARLDL